MKFTSRFLFLSTLLLSLVLVLYLWSPPSAYNFPAWSRYYSNASQLSSHGTVSPEDLFDGSLWKQVALANAKANQFVRNERQFGPLTDEDLVIVVQVHKRLPYLRTLINSMANVRFIEQALVVFSHDFVDEQINQLVAGINFTKVTQIFYPFSTQLWKHTFPGTSPNDCSRDLTKEAALKLNCSNAKYPDTYGHYRESHITQTKHHWWWKANYVFDQLAATKKHNGDFIFLEEDHYLLPDFLHTWKLMRLTRKRLVEQESAVVDMLTLGNYDNNYNAEINADKLHLIEWFSSKHNMAFTVDRALFEKFKLFSTEVCTYDDYNWDWTLQHLVQDCLDDNLLTLFSIVPRVFHIGSCGVHHKKADCSTEKQVHRVEDMYSTYREHFFPRNFTVMRRQNKKTKIVNNGGWSDPRDHQLCIQYELPFEQIIQANPNFVNFKSLLLI